VVTPDTDACRRWVYRQLFVADGNFKADHVRQKNTKQEFWLWDGKGMMLNRPDYLEFLQAAKERQMVRFTLRHVSCIGSEQEKESALRKSVSGHRTVPAEFQSL